MQVFLLVPFLCHALHTVPVYRYVFLMKDNTCLLTLPSVRIVEAMVIVVACVVSFWEKLGLIDLRSRV